MKIAVVSDTHGNWLPVKEAIEAAGGVDYLMFLGDHASDGRQLEKTLQIPAYIVRGNCDDFSDGLEEQLVELDGWRFLLCHGHRYQVKDNLQRIYFRGLEQQVDFVLFGHTHQFLYEEGDVTLLNPGSASRMNMVLNADSWVLLTLSAKKEKNFLKKYEKKACQSY